MTESTPPLEGGCLCGAIRYRLRHVASAYWCHCTMCQRVSGSAALPWASVAQGDFSLSRGSLSIYASSPGVKRGFCGTCGSPILFEMETESQIDITIGTLDAPDSLTPTHHIWTSTARIMSEGLGAGLPRHAAEAPLDEPSPQD